MPWLELASIKPHHFFIPKDFSLQEEYERKLHLDKLYIQNSMGNTTSRDWLNVQYPPAEALRQDALTQDTESFQIKHNARKGSRD